MSALDNLLANSLEELILKKLGGKTYQQIKKRLEEHYGISVLEAIRDFQKMDATLREFFGAGADEIEKDFLNDFVSL
ncbi:MAG: transcriptional regulator, partial [Nitrososphaeraceae archaeon]